MYFVEAVIKDTPTNSTTKRVIMTHKLKDWDAWKREYNSNKQARLDAGLIERSVGHFIDDTHMVTLVFAVTDMAKAKAFMASTDLKDKMTAAGVEGPPTIFYYNAAKRF